jgi:iron-sulfur cluster assembly accessory protein
MIHLTTTAAQEIKRLQRSRGQTHHYFRLGVKPGGCAGWYYTLDLVREIDNSDREFESQGLTILVNETSFPFVENIKLDYAEDLMGGGFRFTNPNTASSCSCGLSFSLPTASTKV